MAKKVAKEKPKTEAKAPAKPKKARAKKAVKSHEESPAELIARLKDLDRELFQLRNELAMNHKLDKPHLLKAKRKEKARILTILTQKSKAAVSA